MKTAIAFMRGEAARAAGAKLMVFDWNKAARLIRERQPESVSAGLCGDWEWTGGEIYRDGSPVTDSYTYLASLWATPEIQIDGVTEECWVYASDALGWDSDTKWPATALAALTEAPSTVPEDYMSDGPWEVA